MNQDRFDMLARGLATGRLTMWQVLKGLWAGCYSFLLGFCSRGTPASRRSNEQENTNAQTIFGRSSGYLSTSPYGFPLRTSVLASG